jgi:hypothetical protein
MTSIKKQELQKLQTEFLKYKTMKDVPYLLWGEIYHMGDSSKWSERAIYKINRRETSNFFIDTFVRIWALQDGDIDHKESHFHFYRERKTLCLGGPSHGFIGCTEEIMALKQLYVRFSNTVWIYYPL